MLLNKLSMGYRLGWGLLGTMMVGVLSGGMPAAEARDLIWQPASSQTSTNPTSPSQESTADVPSENVLTAEELQDTIRGLELIATLDISSSKIKETKRIQEQLQSVQQNQSSPYVLTSNQIQDLRHIFSTLRQTELTAINQLLFNQKSDNPFQLDASAIARLRQNLQETSANNLSEVKQPARVTLQSSNPRPEQEVVSSPSPKDEIQVTTTKPTPPQNQRQNQPRKLQVTQNNTASREELVQNLLVPEPATEEIIVATERSAPAISISVPTGYGARHGQLFSGLDFQDSTRNGDGSDDASFGFGLGIGDPEDSIGVNLTYTSFSTVRSTPFDTGGVSLKLHRILGTTTSAAIGAENFIRYGDFDAETSYYGSVTNIFALRDNITEPFSSLAVTLGVGSGRFRQFDDIEEDNETVNIFGSAGLRVTEQFSLVGAYTGNTLALGASLAPFKEFPLVITPAFTDLTGEFSDDPRFILSVGYGTRLF
ncbi:hypothetical protein PCC7418_2818 [Halothece sp. PCC 7418]|uniref:hypothetical protein n=1 Tax=Halothece sp. (strain PCC 7418) TaxID=65093 RepID=UPI0002A06FA6|nr:hypothetical protein [Halothece sp. PCC 7418]AFZ44950.1 hypothetical protein PCC7418_2818 [Halothece sp. PCC 7418]